MNGRSSVSGEMSAGLGAANGSNLGNIAGGASKIDYAIETLTRISSDCISKPIPLKIQAITQIPQLLDQFPFQTIINTALLKIGDLFQSVESSMFRFEVVKVVEAIQHHLPRMLRPDELLRRIIRVFGSNDSMARTLSLRFLGEAAVIFSHSLKAQHMILKQYGSTDPLELMAVVDTSEKFVKVNPEFLSVIWETLMAKIQDQSIPTTVRSHMIYSLRHANAVSQELCKNLPEYSFRLINDGEKSIEMVSAILTTWASSLMLQKREPSAFPIYPGDATDEHQFSQSQVSLLVDILNKDTLPILKEKASLVLSQWRPNVDDLSSGYGETMIKDVLGEFVDAELSRPSISVSLITFYNVLCTMRRLSDEPADIELVWEKALKVHAHVLELSKIDINNSNSAVDKSLSTPSNSDTDADQWPTDIQESLRNITVTTLFIMKILNVIGLKHANNSMIDKTVEAICLCWKYICQIAAGREDQLKQPYVSNMLKKLMTRSWQFCKRVEQLTQLVNICLDSLDTKCLYLYNTFLLCLTNTCIACPKPDIYEEIISRLISPNSLKDPVHQPQSHDIDTRYRWAATVALLNIAKAEKNTKISIDTIVRETVCTIWDPENFEPKQESTQYPPASLITQTMLLSMSLGLWPEVQFIVGCLMNLDFPPMYAKRLSIISKLAESEIYLKSNTGLDPYFSIFAPVITLAQTDVADHRSGSLISMLLDFHIWSKTFLLTPAPLMSDGNGDNTQNGELDFLSRIQDDMWKGRSKELLSICEYLLHVSPFIDQATRLWLQSTHSILSSYASTIHDQKQKQLGPNGGVDLTMRCGSSLFHPSKFLQFEIETNPVLEGLDKPRQIKCASDFTFEVEGLFTPQSKAINDELRNQLYEESTHHGQSPMTKVRISAWLSDRPWQTWGWDTIGFHRRHLIAYSLPNHATSPTPAAATAATSRNYNRSSWFDGNYTAEEYDIQRKQYLHRASQFVTEIKDQSYFKCQCSIAMPPMKAAKTQADAQIVLYLHISCSAIDQNGQDWHIGPNVSYPLTLHT
ncbi:Integrator complex subunit 7 [Mycoemilia scoparia]|uniref:Integrator complex subunit 7 n=1 Tax=Mycoemilia scoparia TaxID=417184 RepID=A0A9W8A248_9FUNG|nr:Integrator complex subunit 7 [Mycoemilia scoparia]